MELKREFVLREIAGDTLLILGDERNGILITRPEVLSDAADQVFNRMEEEET